MKGKQISRLIPVFIMSLIMTSCTDYDYSESYTGNGGGGNDVELDSRLYGTWSQMVDGQEASYTFYSNGECVQKLYGSSYDWLWAVESDQIKFYVEYGNPTYKKYKIEGDLLYLYVESMSQWGLPFRKQ